MVAMDLPPEVMYNVLEHVDSLDDLGSLSLANKWMADLVGNIRAKTLWRIAYRTCHRRGCDLHQEEQDEVSPCNCSVVVPALQEPGSAPFKVRQWLYRRASMRAFGSSKEALSGCIISKQDDLKNPYTMDIFNGFDKRLGRADACEEDVDVEEREWDQVWLIFKRHLVMQRVQRVNLGDGRVKAGWRRDGEGGTLERGTQLYFWR